MVKKILTGLLFLFLFFAVAVTVVFVLWDRDVEALLVVPASDVPLDWQQQIRSFSDVPGGLARFASDSATEGNAATWIYSVQPNQRLEAYSRVFGEIAAGAGVAAGDSSVLQGVVVDSLLDSLVAVSAMTVYNSTDHSRATSQSQTLQLVDLPDLTQLNRMVHGLLLRAAVREAADDTSGALADIGAVIRLGNLLYRQPTFLVENVAGREYVELAAGQLAGSNALLQADSTLATVAGELVAWSGRRLDYSRLIVAMATDAEATLELVRDTEVLACWRTTGISRLVALQYRPRNIPLGIPGSMSETVTNLRTIADPRVAWVAELAENSIQEFNDLGVLERMRFLQSIVALL